MAVPTAIADALNMPIEEQMTRMRTMREVVEQFNAYRWTADILTDAARLRDHSIPVPTRWPGRVGRAPVC